MGHICHHTLENQGNSKDIMMATNLAREAIEALRNVRDTNWLYYSGSKRSVVATGARDHWNDGFDGRDHFGNTYADLSANTGCTLGNCTSQQITHYFIPELDMYSAIDDNRYQWKLRWIESSLDPTLTDEDLSKYIMGLGKEDYSLYEDETTRLLVQNATYDHNTLGVQSTKFRRLLEISYLESYDDMGLCSPADPTDCKLNVNDNIVKMRSIVTWNDASGDVKHVVLESKISDWFRREDKL